MVVRFVVVLAVIALAGFALNLVGAKPWFRVKVNLPAAGSPQEIAAVRAQADATMSHVDTGDAERLAALVSPVMPAERKAAAWTDVLNSHAALGKLVSREPAEIIFLGSQKGMVGKVAAATYRSTYEKGTVVDKVSLHLFDGEWKVIGYHIKNE